MDNNKTIDFLNDLIQINNDRIAGYVKALKDIREDNIDLRSIFQMYANQSRKNGQELATLVGNYENIETGTSVASTLQRTWIDVRFLFRENDRASILSEAENGENAIKKAYADALSTTGWTPNISDVLARQAQEINMAHEKIKALKNTSKAFQ